MKKNSSSAHNFSAVVLLKKILSRRTVRGGVSRGDRIAVQQYARRRFNHHHALLVEEGYPAVEYHALRRALQDAGAWYPGAPAAIEGYLDIHLDSGQSHHCWELWVDGVSWVASDSTDPYGVMEYHPRIGNPSTEKIYLCCERRDGTLVPEKLLDEQLMEELRRIGFPVMEIRKAKPRLTWWDDELAPPKPHD